MSQTQPSDEWKELKTVLKDVEGIITDNDLKDIITLNQTEQQYYIELTKRMNDAKEIIKGTYLHWYYSSRF